MHVDLDSTQEERSYVLMVFLLLSYDPVMATSVEYGSQTASRIMVSYMRHRLRYRREEAKASVHQTSNANCLRHGFAHSNRANSVMTASSCHTPGYTDLHYSGDPVIWATSTQYRDID